MYRRKIYRQEERFSLYGRECALVRELFNVNLTKACTYVMFDKSKRDSVRYVKLLKNMRVLKTYEMEFLFDFPNIT